VNAESDPESDNGAQSVPDELGDLSITANVESGQGSALVIGIEAPLSRRQAEALRQDLLTLWQGLFGALGSLPEDLQTTRRWFDPVAQGDRLRRAIAELDPDPPFQGPVDSPLVVAVDENRTLITPEGRCAIDLLQRSLALSAELEADETLPLVETHDIERLLLRTYREWGRHRLDGVVRLLNGQDKPLQVPAAGLVLALLVNRSTAPTRAMVRYRTGVRRQQVDDAFFGPVAAFSRCLAPKTRADPAKWRLISGWHSGEARRRLGQAFVLEREQTERDGKIYILESHQHEVLDLLVRDLRRGHRAPVTLQMMEQAWTELVAAFRESVPALAGYGLVHERPLDTARLGQELWQRFELLDASESTELA
jgi:hypothetical protein